MYTRTALMRPREVPPARRSARFIRAAEGERAVLARRRDELASRSETLRGERERIEITLIGLNERIALLDRLAELSAQPSCSPAPDGDAHTQRLAGKIASRLAIRAITSLVLASTHAPRNSVHHQQGFDVIPDARRRPHPSANHDSELS